MGAFANIVPLKNDIFEAKNNKTVEFDNDSPNN